MKLKQNPQVHTKFESYPKHIAKKLTDLRALIVASASAIEHIQEMEETLKWGEPSYLVSKGSTVRMDWKPAKPEQYAMYFKCTSKLVETFKVLYPTLFSYEKNRAIVFSLDAKVPKKELQHCISLALTYHRVKHLPLLGGK